VGVALSSGGSEAAAAALYLGGAAIGAC
jgi:hypothetical protein